jgi:Ca2+-binding RTX toxin-like protein
VTTNEEVRKDDVMQDSPIRRGLRCGIGAACGALALAAGPGTAVAAAADPGFTCRSSTVRAQLLTGDPIEPLAANRLGARCADDTVGLENLGGALPGDLDLDLDLAFASTATNGAAVPSARAVEARAAAALGSVPGTAGTLRVEGLSASVTGSCAAGVAKLAGASSVARITLAGHELPTDQVVTQALNGIGGTPLGAILRIVPGEEIRSGAGADASLTRRALHVTIALGGQNLVDAVLGEATAGTADSACTATTVPGGGGGGGTGGGAGGGGGADTGLLGAAASGRPVAGLPFGGGRAVTLAALARLGVGANHPCRNRRYGRNIALVGTSRRDRMSGSNLADRMFGFRRGDSLSGAIGGDCVDGGGGRDRLSGSLGGDFLIGGAGRDRVWGGPGRDRVRGGAGRDVVNGESGNDRLRGGRGNDTLSAGFGRDRVHGGRGNDTINAAVAGPRQVVDCGRGRDEVRLNFGDRQRNCERVLRIR